MTTNKKTKTLVLKDAPGVALRHMGDPANRQEAEYLFQAPDNLRETTNRYSFVIENISDKAILALSLAYSFPKDAADKRSGMLRTDAIHARLINPASDPLMRPGTKAGICLALTQQSFDFKNGIRYVQPETPPHPQMTEAQLKQMNQATLLRFAGFDRLLNEADHWEVEIEGVIFDDGTFAGTSRRQHFEQNNAKIAGARSLADDLLGMAGKGAAHADLVAKAKAYAVSFEELLKPFGGSIADAERDESFNFQFAKTSVARRFMHLPEADGINYLRQGQQHWVKLKKLG